MIYVHGNGNQFYGTSSNYNLVYMFGDGNTFDARGGSGYVLGITWSGNTDTISSSNGLYVTSFTADPAWFGW